ncbi:hypothetical protein [Streptomyces sp. NPDC046979]|uniref:hypothetical protein n=1 Tax=Streptomyces sp. NPDC046979 TaxID=3154604 RepID=UPI0033DF24F6
MGGQSVIIGSAPALSILTAVAAVATGNRHRGPLRRGPDRLRVLLALALALTTVLTLIVPARAARNERTL